MISVCEPLLGERELQYVTDCIKTNWISSKGKYIEEFEQKFAGYCGCKYGVTTTSGTTALHLALVSLGIGNGDGKSNVGGRRPTRGKSRLIYSYTGAVNLYIRKIGVFDYITIRRSSVGGDLICQNPYLIAIDMGFKVDWGRGLPRVQRGDIIPGYSPRPITVLNIGIR